MKTRTPSNLSRIKVQVVSGLSIAVVTSSIAFAWNTNTRLTRLETALISLAADVHDIKALLEHKGRR